MIYLMLYQNEVLIYLTYNWGWRRELGGIFKLHHQILSIKINHNNSFYYL